MSSSEHQLLTKETIFPESDKIVIRSWNSISSARANELVTIARLLSKAHIGPACTSSHFDPASKSLSIAVERAYNGPCRNAICLSDSLLYHRQESAVEGHVLFLKDAVRDSEPRQLLVKLLIKLNRHGYLITERIHWKNFGWRLNNFNRPRPIILEIDNIRHRDQIVDIRQTLHNSIDQVNKLPLSKIIVPRLRINIELTDEDRAYIYTQLARSTHPALRQLAVNFTHPVQISIPPAAD